MSAVSDFQPRVAPVRSGSGYRGVITEGEPRRSNECTHRHRTTTGAVTSSLDDDEEMPDA